MSSDLRAYLKAQIMPKLPDTWKWVDTMRTIDVIEQPTVTYKLLGLEPLAEAPLGTLRARVVLTLTTPLADPEKAETQIDEDVLALVLALDGHSDIAWTDASKVKDDRLDRLAWDLNTTAIITKNQEA